MNKNQRIILFATAFILIVMLLFPPFKLSTPSGVTLNAGYSFILSPPIPADYYMDVIDFIRQYAKVPVDSILLLIQFLIVISVGGIFFLALKSK